MTTMMSKNVFNRGRYSHLLIQLYKKEALTNEQLRDAITSILQEYKDVDEDDTPQLLINFGSLLASLYVNGVIDNDVRYLCSYENNAHLSVHAIDLVVHTAVEVKVMTDVETGVEFFKAAIDVTELDLEQQEQLKSTMKKQDVLFLMGQ